jgi:hypothetical protein
MGEVTRTVWLRNVGRGAGLTMEFVAENAALMLAFRQAAAIMSEHVDPRQSSRLPGEMMGTGRARFSCSSRRVITRLRARLTSSFSRAVADQGFACA